MILWRVDWPVLLAVLAEVRIGWLVPVALCVAAHFLLKGLRWAVLLRSAADVPVLFCIRLTLVGLFLNNIAPAHIGELSRPYLLRARRPDLDFSFLLATLVADKLLDLLVLASLLMITALLVPLPAWARPGLLVLGAAGSLGLGFAMVAARWRKPGEPDRGRLHGLLSRMLGSRARGAQDTMSRFLQGIGTMVQPRVFPVAVGLTLLVYLLIWLSLLCCLHAVGLSVSPAQAAFVLALIGVGSAVPQPPSGAGNFHFFATQGLLLSGMTVLEPVVAFALIAHASNALVITLMGLPSMIGLRWRWRGGPTGGPDAQGQK